MAKSDSAVIREHFRLAERFLKTARLSQSLRQASDYELYATIEEEQVEELVVRAQEFVDHLKKLLSIS